MVISRREFLRNGGKALFGGLVALSLGGCAELAQSFGGGFITKEELVNINVHGTLMII